jgi:hypothetical protein
LRSRWASAATPARRQSRSNGGSGSTDRTAQINADGEAWFQDENKPLPKFLPIAFGSVNSNGTVAGGSGNFSVTLSSSVYKITVTGHTIAWPDYSVVATSHNIIPTVPLHLDAIG